MHIPNPPQQRHTLLCDTNSLSIQQMVAYYTLIMVQKITKTGKPAYLEKYEGGEDER
jgi:hypothetical protein